MSRNDVLDPRECRFVEAYCESNNGTRAALIAGYGRNYNSAAVQANYLLKRSKIRNAIDQRNAQIMQKLDLTPERILRELAGMATVDGVEIKADHKLKSLIELAKIAKLYPAMQTELSGPNGGPLQTASVNVNHTMDIASLEPEQRDQLRQVLLALKAKEADGS
jgi:phage terminase small subunit